jgi:hypothetical protein
MMMDSSSPEGGKGTDHDSSLSMSERSATRSIMPIEMEDTSASFPAVEEIRGDIAYSAKKNRNRRWIKRGSLLVLALFFVLIIVIATSVGLSKRSDRSAGTRRAASPAGVVEFMAAEGVALNNLQKEGTPQERAARWLAEEDPANIPVPTEKAPEHEKFRYTVRYVTDDALWLSSVRRVALLLTRCAVVMRLAA